MYVWPYIMCLLSNPVFEVEGGNHIRITSMKLLSGLVSQSLAPYEVSLKLETRYCALKAFSGWSNTFQVTKINEINKLNEIILLVEKK